MIKAYAVDIGNTAIKCAFFEQGEVVNHLRIAHDKTDILVSFLEIEARIPIIISSTASKDIQVPAAALKGRKVIHLDKVTPIPISLDYDRSGLGLDRLANAVAGNSLNPPASLVIDAGTCITYDYTVAGTYMGGNISPGLDMRLKAMHSFTGRLPLLEKSDQVRYVGKDTKQAMQGGALIGIQLELDGIITEFYSRYPHGKVYLTGGDGPLLAERIENAIFAAPFLTLKGLYEILLHTL